MKSTLCFMKVGVKCCLLFAILLGIISPKSFAQDTLHKSSTLQLGLDVSYQWHGYSQQAQILAPNNILENRKHNQGIFLNYDTISDNPYRHGALYAALKSKFNYKSKLELNLDAYFEYRGLSYGTYYKDNRVFYPVMRVTFKDTFNVAKNRTKVNFQLGQFLDEKTDMGLTVDNMDLQGVKLSFEIGKSVLGASLYADLSNSIRLNIDNYFHYYFQRKFNKNKLLIGISSDFAAPAYSNNKYHNYLSLYSSFNAGKSIKLFGQFGYYNLLLNGANLPFNGFNRDIALVTGVANDFESRKLKWKNKLSLRYYGMNYNLSHEPYGFLYRDSAKSLLEMYGNTTGKYLYPLRKFETPFNQWAVYTEYGGYNVWGVSSTGFLEYSASQKVKAKLDYDMCWIKGRLDDIFSTTYDRNSTFLYPFFKFSIEYFPAEIAHVALFLSNKTMNLDVGYPTHYLLKKPFVGFSLTMNAANIFRYSR